MGERIHILVDPELKDFLPRYLENRKRDLQALKAAFENNDLKRVQMISHKIRGHALSYGFTPLSHICTQIERAVTENHAETIKSLLNEYSEYIEKVDLD